MHEGLWEKLVKLDPTNCQLRSNCEYLADSNSYVVRLLDKDYTVNLNSSQIFLVNSNQDNEQSSFLHQLCILAYLINATYIPLAGKLVTDTKLEGGQFFFRGQHKLPTEKIEQAFGKNPELLYKATEHLNAKRCDFGDASVEIFILLRVPVVFVIWAGDEEFDARASILFDQTVTAQLQLDALLAAVDLAVDSTLQKL